MKRLSFTSFLLLSLFVIITGTSSCSKKNEGCTNANAFNFDPDADTDNGSCYTLNDFLTGEWIAISYLVDGMEQIGSTYNSVSWMLNANGTISIEAVEPTQLKLNSTGTWDTDISMFVLTFDFETAEFMPCPGLAAGYFFGVAVTNPELITLNTLCNMGPLLAITLLKN